MSKIFVLDTNVLLADVDAIHSFSPGHIIIPLTVLEELDRLKARQDDTGFIARQVNRKLDELRSFGKLSQGVTLPNGGSLSVATVDQTFLSKLPLELRQNLTVDNSLLAIALARMAAEPEREVKIISKDINVRIKADALDIPCEDYLKLRINKSQDEFYTGVITFHVEQGLIDNVYASGALDVADLPDDCASRLYPNQIVVLKCVTGESSSAIGIYDVNKKQIRKLTEYKEVFGLKPRNKEQNFAFNLLFDANMKLITLSGRAGAGKNLVAIAAGLQEVLENKRYEKLVICRPIEYVGNSVGLLPGDLKEKLAPWLAPIRDNLDFLWGTNTKLSGGEPRKKKVGANGMEAEAKDPYLDLLLKNGKIEIQTIEHIRGRSIANAYIIIDESQNISVHQLKTIVTRVGEGSKIVLIGDPEQIDNTHVDIYTNGLVYGIEKFKDTHIAGHITLIKGERSELATVASAIL